MAIIIKRKHWGQNCSAEWRSVMVCLRFRVCREYFCLASPQAGAIINVRGGGGVKPASISCPHHPPSMLIIRYDIAAQGVHCRLWRRRACEMLCTVWSLMFGRMAVTCQRVMSCPSVCLFLAGFYTARCLRVCGIFAESSVPNAVLTQPLYTGVLEKPGR